MVKSNQNSKNSIVKKQSKSLLQRLVSSEIKLMDGYVLIADFLQYLRMEVLQYNKYAI